jgi:hypothetical protein
MTIFLLVWAKKASAIASAFFSIAGVRITLDDFLVKCRALVLAP